MQNSECQLSSKESMEEEKEQKKKLLFEKNPLDRQVFCKLSICVLSVDRNEVIKRENEWDRERKKE